MSLFQLPDELLCAIGDCLSCYRDVRALVLSNRRLNRIFTAILPRYSAKKCHGSLLSCAAHSADICLVVEILDRLAVLNDKRKEAASMQKEHQATDTHDDDLVDHDDRAFQQIQKHPLYAAGYRVRDIFSIQCALLAAIPTGSKQLVGCLLERGAVATFTSPSGNGSPSITLAVKHGYDEIFDLLMEHDAHACDENECPVVEAVKGGRFHMTRVLLEVGVCIHWDAALSAALDDRAMFDFMVDNGVAIENNGDMALFDAIVKGKKEWVEFLISRGADPNLLDCLPTDGVILEGTMPYSTIYHAILYGHLEICKLLIEHGVQPEEDDLQLAREKGYNEIVNILSTFSYTNVPEKEERVTKWINAHI